LPNNDPKYNDQANNKNNNNNNKLCFAGKLFSKIYESFFCKKRAEDKMNASLGNQARVCNKMFEQKNRLTASLK
jgi:hypothetical protein